MSTSDSNANNERTAETPYLVPVIRDGDVVRTPAACTESAESVRTPSEIALLEAERERHVAEIAIGLKCVEERNALLKNWHEDDENKEDKPFTKFASDRWTIVFKRWNYSIVDKHAPVEKQVPLALSAPRRTPAKAAALTPFSKDRTKHSTAMRERQEREVVERLFGGDMTHMYECVDRCNRRPWFTGRDPKLTGVGNMDDTAAGVKKMMNRLIATGHAQRAGGAS